jgi:hypothetical protein
MNTLEANQFKKKQTIMEKELIIFAENCKFKTTKSNTYTYFTINEEKQIRIYRNNKTTYNTIKYQVTLHTIDEDGITYKPYERNECACSLRDAKLIAAKYYYETIRNQNNK